MLRKAGSEYIGSRSNTLLKVKSFHDTEAKVLEYEKGKGKYKGKTGALWCLLPSGKRFSVGSGY
jgi:DNA ligase-1